MTLEIVFVVAAPLLGKNFTLQLITRYLGIMAMHSTCFVDLGKA